MIDYFDGWLCAILGGSYREGNSNNWKLGFLTAKELM